jgi:hypothetical protein
MFNDHIRLTSITVCACSLPLIHPREVFYAHGRLAFGVSFGMGMDLAIPKVHSSSIFLPVSVFSILYVAHGGRERSILPAPTKQTKHIF